MKTFVNYCSIIFIVLFSNFSMAQNWDWFHETYDTLSDSWFTISHHNNENSFYVIGNYYDTILFPDTSFIHSDNSYGTFKAIGEYNTDGEFIKGFDIYSIPNNLITHTELVSTQNNDLFVSGGFQDVMFCNGEVIQHGNTAFTYLPEVFLVKMDEDFNVLWSDVIGGDLQDDLLNLDVTSNDKIAIATKHVGGFCYFLSQDTVTHEQGFISIALIEENKDLIWRKDIVGAVNGHMSVGEDDNIHFFGSCYTDFILDGDTVFNPNEEHHPNNSRRNISVTISKEGEVLDKRFLDFEMIFWDSYYNEFGELYAYGNIHDTIVFQNDTLIGNEYGTNTELIAKLNANFEVEWYKFFKTVGDGGFTISFLPAQLRDNHLFIAISANEDFYINEDLISSDHPSKSLIVDIDELGNFGWTKVLTGDSRIRVADIILDNCSNILLNAYYSGNVYFDQDTLSTNSEEYYEDLFAKLTLNPTNINLLGEDTIACDSILLTAPEGFSNYNWDGVLSNQNTYLVNETKEVALSIGDENNCWVFDTIQIDIQNGFVFNIGSDTSIYENDTTSFTPNGISVYESYLWSDSSRLSFIDIIGNQYGIGEFNIWLEASVGVCSYRDSLTLTIEQGYGLNDIESNNLTIYPNPCNGQLIVELLELDHSEHNYVIYNLKGQKQKEGKLISKSHIIDIESLDSGIYLLFIVDSKHKKNIIRKFVKE